MVHMWAWSCPSLPVQLSAHHGQLTCLTCTSVDIFDVVRCLMHILPPPRKLAVSRSIGIKPGYVASCWASHSRPVIVHTGK